MLNRGQIGVLRLAFWRDEETPIAKRLDQLIQQNGKTMVPGLGRAVLTIILLIHSPDKYGVWNGTSEAAMKSYELWPRFERGASFGTRFLQEKESSIDSFLLSPCRSDQDR